MSTRANIRLFADDIEVARFYVHHDGYPEAPGLGMELWEVFKDIKRKKKPITVADALQRIEFAVPRAERISTEYEVNDDIEYVYDIYLNRKMIEVIEVAYDWRKGHRNYPVINWRRDLWEFKKEYKDFCKYNR